MNGIPKRHCMLYRLFSNQVLGVCVTRVKNRLRNSIRFRTDGSLFVLQSTLQRAQIVFSETMAKLRRGKSPDDRRWTFLALNSEPLKLIHIHLTGEKPGKGADKFVLQKQLMENHVIKSVLEADS